jgi:tetratricopeptide (TPR) repeat protein
MSFYMVQETACVLADQSIILRQRGQFTEAAACARRAAETLEGIIKPTDETCFKKVLSWALRCEGKALERLHRSAEASACYQRAAELLAKPANPLPSTP